ncbi:MAG TPA: hypothetical protein VFI28_06180 [Candidatus Limnocylindrales bacterium]|nr:hypothetical protein [Candidatus Limnocylindrales bacterium]
MTARPPSLPDVLGALAEMLGDVERRTTPEGTICARAGREFAVVGTRGVAVALDGAIAAAARRTPDVAPSTRGADWISFRPRELDRYALDRATAWFEAAWRRAEPTDTRAARPN